MRKHFPIATFWLWWPHFPGMNSFTIRDIVFPPDSFYQLGHLPAVSGLLPICWRHCHLVQRFLLYPHFYQQFLYTQSWYKINASQSIPWPVRRFHFRNILQSHECIVYFYSIWFLIICNFLISQNFNVNISLIHLALTLSFPFAYL